MRNNPFSFYFTNRGGTGVFLWLTLGIMALTSSPSALSAQETSAPVTRREEVVDVLHGVNISDPYRWLEDQTSPETRAWVTTQNAHTKSLLSSWKGRAKLEKRLSELLKIDVINTPTERKGYYYYSKRLANQDQPVLYRRKGDKGAEEPLLDPNIMSADKTVSVQVMDISQDGEMLAYGIQRGGEDEVEVHFMATASQKPLKDVLPRARYSGVAFTADNKSVYFGHQEAEGPRVRHHVFGADPKEASLIFGEKYTPSQGVGVDISEDGHYLLFTFYFGSAASKTDVYIKDLTVEGSEIIPIVNDIVAKFSPHIIGETLYLETNWNAPNGRVLKVDLNDPDKSRWKEIISENPTSVLQSLSFVGGRIFVNYLENVASHIRIYKPDGAPDGEIKFSTLGTASGVSGSWKRKEAFYTFASFALPRTIYRFDIGKRTETEWAKLNIPIDPSQFEVKQVFYPSKDGTKIPMFLIYKKGLLLDGNHPTLLYGYGGFNLSMTPSFSANIAMWAENGGVYAIANLRGGGEYGEAWHRAGMLEKKQNVFDDFIAAGEWLIANRYTNSKRLAIMGGSNGGLLVGAALTQRPDLFRAVICAVPLLDMVRFHKFLIARFWVPEYGSAENPEQFKYIHAYSPYHNVKKGTEYPATMFVTGDADTRVAPLHARKMAALLQWANGSDKPILLHYDTKAGHSGGKPINKVIEDAADEQGFLYWQLGMEPK
ncbi:prolyl endopeptidase [Armatimonadota bacterium]|nr:prolyl endopeptidase [Armatimonadota bacterium]